jgi:hypothetical protein
VVEGAPITEGEQWTGQSPRGEPGGSPVVSRHVVGIDLWVKGLARVGVLPVGGSTLERVLASSWLTARSWFGDIGLSGSERVPESVLQDVSRIIEDMAPRGAEEAAEIHAAGYSLADTVGVVESVGVGGLVELIRDAQVKARVDRFNLSRCFRMFGGDPEFDTLMRIAAEGVTIDVGTNFSPNSIPDAPRQLESKLRGTVALHVLRLQREGAVLLVRPAVSALGVPHYSNLHWTPKPGKPEGRLLCDCSNRENGLPLNSESAKDMGRARYGDLRHPTIVEIVTSVCTVADRLGSMSAVRLWKEDVAKAFEQCDFRAADCHLLTVRLAHNLDMVYVRGNFGWAIMPFAWGVLSRGLGRLCDKRLRGIATVYVDDVMGAGSEGEAHVDQAATQDILVGVFGEGGWNKEKTVAPSTSADFIGWHLDTVKGSIRPNAKGIRKLVGCFFAVDIAGGKSIKLREAQRLASLASRYSQCLLGLRPFVQPLVALTVGGFAARRPCARAKVAIVVWRAVSLVLLLNPEALAVPMRSLVPRAPGDRLYVVTDAGPEGLGAGVFDQEGLCLGHLSYRLPYNARDSRFQNVREFHGLVLAQVLLSHLRFMHQEFDWVGDNVAALSWASKDYCSSAAGQSAFLAHTWLTLASGNSLATTSHRAGVHMGDIDRLSRFNATVSLSSASRLHGVQHLDELFGLCDPTRPDSETTKLADTLTLVVGVVRKIVESS